MHVSGRLAGFLYMAADGRNKLQKVPMLLPRLLRPDLDALQAMITMPLQSQFSS